MLEHKFHVISTVLLSHCSGDRRLVKALTSVAVTSYIEMLTHLIVSLLNGDAQTSTISMASCMKYEARRAYLLLDLILHQVLDSFSKKT
jgi:hypothetical protein